MKRKIGLIVALILAITGVMALKSGNAAAADTPGKGDDVKYCAITAYVDSDLKACVALLSYFHGWESDAGSLSYIKKHVSISTNYVAESNGGRTANEAYDLIYTWYRDSKNSIKKSYDLYGDTVAKAIQACKTDAPHDENGCIKNRGNPTAFQSKKLGKSYVPICYTDYYNWDQFKTTCGQGINNDSDKDKDKDKDDPASGETDTEVPGGDPDHCSTLFPDSWCQGDGGISKVLRFVVAVLTGAVAVAGAVGIIICAVLILTARDNEQQLATGKKRLMQVVVGIIAWALLAAIMNLLIPEPTSYDDLGMIEVNVQSEKGEKA